MLIIIHTAIATMSRELSLLIAIMPKEFGQVTSAKVSRI
jgi:hypothetical protein